MRWPSTVRRLFLSVTCFCLAFSSGRRLLLWSSVAGFGDGASYFALAIFTSIAAALAIAGLISDEVKAAINGCAVAAICLLFAWVRFLVILY